MQSEKKGALTVKVRSYSWQISFTHLSRSEGRALAVLYLTVGWRLLLKSFALGGRKHHAP